MTSIRHFPATQPLPDWRNVGIVLRLVLGANLMLLFGALFQTPDIEGWHLHYLNMAGFAEPLLMALLTVLLLLRDALWRLPLRLGQTLILLLVAALTAGMGHYGVVLGLLASSSMPRTILLAVVIAGCLLVYFEHRARAFTPAESEARLAALNARIRPHFLFNSLNTALSLVRTRPALAEEALEALADLFRAAMRDPAERVVLAEEISLCRQYLELEKLRLGERLSVEWHIENASMNLPIPPLMLQPLLENAVRHGIEPLPDGGMVRVELSEKDEMLEILVANPASKPGVYASGNQIALDNIRERLALYYDLEARLDILAGGANYEVRITLPCRRKHP